MNFRHKIAAIVFLVIASIGASNAQVLIQVDPHEAGKVIPENFLGLSFETSSTLPDTNGRYPYFDPTNRPLIQLLHTLGVKNVRIGGNTSDRPSVPIPSIADINEVFSFAKKAHVRLIYTLRLRDSTPSTVQQTAKHIMDRYPDQVDCLVVGNEPNVYEHTYPKYAADLKAFYPAILSSAPRSKFCGPSTTPGSGVWVNNYVRDFHQMPQLYQITQHSYPGGNSRRVSDASAGRANILSSAFEKNYQKLYDVFAPTVEAAGLKYRLEETNSYYNGGAKDVSNTFASSLWALSYMYWWLDHDAQGINFHTGDQVAAGEVQTPCWYATFWKTPAGLDIHPIAYALAAFHLAGHGTLIPVKLSAAPDSLEAFATIQRDGELYVTLINKNFGNTAKQVDTEIQFPPGYAYANTMTLDAPDAQVAATTGIRLGGSLIHPDGTWSGRWTKIPVNQQQGFIKLHLQPASAVIVRMATSTKH